MGQIHIHNLFPVPVMRVEGFLDQSAIANAVDAVRNVARLHNAQTDLLSHTEVIRPQQNPHFAHIGELAQDYLRDFGFLLFGENLRWHIKEMWMNQLSRGGHQVMHSHANSFISGVIYLTESDESAKTVFHNSMGSRQFVFSNSHAESATTPYNGERWVASDMQQGDLMLFPSYMLHAVPRNEGQERITIAFNALPERLKSWDYEVRFSE
ncbi:MAG: TIGR02466 family protein [Pseudomonadota bacterium]|nr:TIGR02466 family protein [Pseudomonadota bacterium]